MTGEQSGAGATAGAPPGGWRRRRSAPGCRLPLHRRSCRRLALYAGLSLAVAGLGGAQSGPDGCPLAG